MKCKAIGNLEARRYQSVTKWLKQKVHSSFIIRPYSLFAKNQTLSRRFVTRLLSTVSTSDDLKFSCIKPIQHGSFLQISVQSQKRLYVVKMCPVGYTADIFMQKYQVFVYLLTSSQRKARLNWYREHIYKTHNQWANMHFID